jgi:uncharacterized protein
MSLHAVVPTLIHSLGQLRHLLRKGEQHALAHAWDPAVLLGMRLAPDMFPLLRQVQMAIDLGKSAAARLTGGEVPTFDDTATNFGELDARLAALIDQLAGLPAAAFDGAQTREIVIATRKYGDLRFGGRQYLDEFLLPNLYFHITTAYALLRHAGVPLSKVDYLGPIGGRTAS